MLTSEITVITVVIPEPSGAWVLGLWVGALHYSVSLARSWQCQLLKWSQIGCTWLLCRLWSDGSFVRHLTGIWGKRTMDRRDVSVRCRPCWGGKVFTGDLTNLPREYVSRVTIAEVVGQSWNDSNSIKPLSLMRSILVICFEVVHA